MFEYFEFVEKYYTFRIAMLVNHIRCPRSTPLQCSYEIKLYPSPTADLEWLSPAY